MLFKERPLDGELVVFFRKTSLPRAVLSPAFMSRSPTSLYTPPLSPRRHHQQRIVDEEEEFSSSAVILHSADTGVGLLHTTASAAFFPSRGGFSAHTQDGKNITGEKTITAEGECEMYPI